MIRLLTFNSHEAYCFDLARLGMPMDVVVELAGHHHRNWDERMRPLPANVRLCTMQEARGRRYDCIIAHNLTDLLACRGMAGAKILTFHSSLQGRLKQEQRGESGAEIRTLVDKYLKAVQALPVVISPMKQNTWALDRAKVIQGAVDCEEYCGYDGALDLGLRVANHITLKTEYLRWPLHEAAFQTATNEEPNAGSDRPNVRLVGVNPDFAGVEPASCWQTLKAYYRKHRFYVHTAAAPLEDGYNLAMLEAMATGMPIVTATHPSCPITQGVEGFVCDTADELRLAARRLLADRELATRMGQAARARARIDFSMKRFVSAWRETITEAIQSRTT